jgi:hypothetical protein
MSKRLVDMQNIQSLREVKYNFDIRGLSLGRLPISSLATPSPSLFFEQQMMNFIKI